MKQLKCGKADSNLDFLADINDVYMLIRSSIVCYSMLFFSTARPEYPLIIV